MKSINLEEVLTTAMQVALVEGRDEDVRGMVEVLRSCIGDYEMFMMLADMRYNIKRYSGGLGAYLQALEFKQGDIHALDGVVLCLGKVLEELPESCERKVHLRKLLDTTGETILDNGNYDGRLLQDIVCVYSGLDPEHPNYSRALACFELIRVEDETN